MCVHRTKDGKCLKHSDNNVLSFCVDGPCPDEVQTNADRIRAMTDEELATMLKEYKDCGKRCIMSSGKHCYQICEETSVLLKWLQQPAKED